MTKKSDELRKVVNDLLQQASEQLDEVRELMTRSRDRFEADFHRLKLERDKLLQRLGEQTLKLSNQGQMKHLPAVVRRTVDRLNEILESLGNIQSNKTNKAPAKKSTQKAAVSVPATPAPKAAPKQTKVVAKRTTKKAAKKVTKKAAKKVTKKAAKKVTKKTAKKVTKKTSKKKVAKKKPASAKKAKKTAKKATKRTTNSK